MTRQAAFENAGRPLKGALHCHTTRSDGKGTPEEVIRLHAQNGYDFMALTDHRIYNYQNFADVPMTILGGMELDRNFPTARVHCHHIVCIGPEKAHGNGFNQDDRFDRFYGDDPAGTQEVLDWVHANNNLTIYCHPEWSGTPAREFEMLRGNFAMEIWNTGSVMEDDLDSNAPYWDELLAQGQRIFGVATDDGHAMNQHCKGWVMVNSENNADAILSALARGAFYSSCGPEIHDFYIDGDTVHVECSPVQSIVLRHLRAPYAAVRPAEGEENLTHAEFRLCRGEDVRYVRAVVKDAQGRRAWTNPIFFEG